MLTIEQGDIIKIDRGKVPFLVVSSDYFNTSGMLVVCPIVPSSDEDALHVRIRGQRTEGVVLCEDIASFSARKRGCTSIDRIQTGELLEIIYRIQSIFDFFPHAK